MERIIINKGNTTGVCPLSSEAIRLYSERSGIEAAMVMHKFNRAPFFLRRDPILIEIIEELGVRANVDDYACLVVVDVPDEYRGVIKARRMGDSESVEFKWKEDHLRKLIRLGNEDDIVNYVAGRLV